MTMISNFSPIFVQIIEKYLLFNLTDKDKVIRQKNSMKA